MFLPICTAVFFTAVAILRALNIYVSIIEADVAYEEVFVRSLSLIRDGAVLIAYGFSVSCVVYWARERGRGGALGCAALMSGVIFADRAFCILYDLAVSNINIRETETLTTALIWLSTDVLFFLCMYFGGALIASAAEKRRAASGTSEGIPVGSLGATAGIMALLQLGSQLVICVQFFMEYDDVTGTEKAQMLGDILFILVEYGGILAAAAMAFYLLIYRLHKKNAKKS